MEKIEQILKILIDKLEGINYAFIGSFNLYLQGIDVSIGDIDILTTPEEIKKIAELLKKYQTKEIYFDKSEGRNSYRTFFEIHGKEIEVLGNVNNLYRSKDSLDKKISVDYKGIKIPCIPLEEELKTYRKIGRENRVKLIEEKIKNEIKEN